MKDLFGNEILEPVKSTRPENLGAMTRHRQLLALHGSKDEKCKNCKHFIRKEYAKVYFKCDLVGVTANANTDWRSGWQACGKFESWMQKGATFNESRTHRYKLWRIWDESKPLILWMMHNPSTADANQDDPTIRRIMKFSEEWGYGGLYVVNLIPYRATDPADLLKVPVEELCNRENIYAIEECEKICTMKVLAHGNPVIKSERYVASNGWQYLELSKSGNPKHPLYLKGNLTLKPML